MSTSIDAFRSEHRGRCSARSCSAVIFFAPTEASHGERTIPLDWMPDPKGNVVLVEGLWGDARARVLGKGAPRPADTVTFMPHHASCSARAAWARRKAAT